MKKTIFNTLMAVVAVALRSIPCRERVGDGAGGILQIYQKEIW